MYSKIRIWKILLFVKKAKLQNKNLRKIKIKLKALEDINYVLIPSYSSPNFFSHLFFANFSFFIKIITIDKNGIHKTITKRVT